MPKLQQVRFCGGGHHSNGELSDDGYADRGRVHPKITGRGKKMTEIVVDQIKKYVGERLVAVKGDVARGEEYKDDRGFFRFWEGRVIADKKHEESLEHILEIISKG